MINPLRDSTVPGAFCVQYVPDSAAQGKQSVKHVGWRDRNSKPVSTCCCYLRELLQTFEPSLAAAILDPVFERFAESLAAAASAGPELSAKCESLTNSLARFFE